MKARYLTYYSYIGTNFRASEKLWPIKGVINTHDPSSVQGLMEIALLHLHSLNKPKVCLSSRTDGGVHALNATAHLDLVRYGDKIYTPEVIVQTLNKYFIKNDRRIIINKCIRVPDDFDSRRKAISRTYLYRLAVAKKGIDFSDTGIVPRFPIEEWRRCHFVHVPDFNIDKFTKGASYLEGFHDFGTFKKYDKIKPYKHNRRLLYSVTVREGRPALTSYSIENKEKLFDYYDIYFHGHSFVHNQIRRMLGALLGVAAGIITPEDIKVMLQIPSKHSWPSTLHTSPPHGLYLCNIEYDPKDLIFEPNTATTEDSSECNN